MPLHHYRLGVTWTGNHGEGTSRYRAYGRDHVIRAPAKPDLLGSSDPAFLGDPACYNPEDLFVASLSTCHMLWYLHLSVGARLVVIAYEDEPEGVMEEEEDGGGRFVSVTLRPRVTIKPGGDVALASSLHVSAHKKCFIANSVSCPVTCEPTIVTEP